MDYYEEERGSHLIFGIFNDRTILTRAVNELQEAGFRKSDISVLMQDKDDSESFATKMDTRVPEGAFDTGFVEGLIETGVSRADARRFESHIQSDGMLLSVQVMDEEWCSKARDILEECGGEDIIDAGGNELPHRSFESDRDVRLSRGDTGQNSNDHRRDPDI